MKSTPIDFPYIPMSLYTLPFAETVLLEDDTPINPWINDLQDFPPLEQSLPTTHSLSSNRHSSSNEWDIISITQDDDWVDLKPTFADVAESAGVHHEPISTYQSMKICSRLSHGSLNHHDHKQVDEQDLYDSLSNDLYEHYKSQARIATRRNPYIQRHRQNVQQVVLRRDLRSLPQVHEKYNRRLSKVENALKATCDKREIAYNNWKSALVLEAPKDVQVNPSMSDTLPPKGTIQAPYIHTIVTRRRKRRQRTVYTQVVKVEMDLAEEYKQFYRVLGQELLQRHLVRQQPDVVGAALDSGVGGWIYDFYNNKAFVYHEMKNILVSSIRYWHISHHEFEGTNASFEEYLEYTRELKRIVNEEFKPNANIAFYPSRWISCSRLLSILYLRDLLKMDNEHRQLTDALDDIHKKDVLKTLYKAISKTRPSFHAKHLRKHLIQYFLKQWTSCK